MQAVSVGGESGVDIEAIFPAGDHVGQQIGRREALPTTSPKLMAGFKWQPEMCPMAKAMVRTVRPKARATPANPMPRPGKPAASTAAPHPPKTSQKVPKNSA